MTRYLYSIQLARPPPLPPPSPFRIDTRDSVDESANTRADNGASAPGAARVERKPPREGRGAKQLHRHPRILDATLIILRLFREPPVARARGRMRATHARRMARRVRTRSLARERIRMPCACNYARTGPGRRTRFISRRYLHPSAFGIRVIKRPRDLFPRTPSTAREEGPRFRTTPRI